MAKILLLFILLILGSCSRKTQVHSQANSEYDFNSNKLFSWYTDRTPVTGVNFISTPAIDLKVKGAIFREMYLRGYNFSNRPGSLIFHHNITINRPTVADPAETGESSNAFLFHSSKISATFILYLVDPGTNQIVWRACTIQDLQSTGQNPSEEIASQIDALLEVVIPRIFVHFPVDPLQITK